MRASERMTLAVAAAVMLAALCLAALTLDRDYLGVTGTLVGASALVAIAGRRFRLPETAVRLLITVPGLLLLIGVGLERLPILVADTGNYIRESWAPMNPHDGFLLISSFVLWLLYLVAETVGVALNRPGWTFPILVLPYLVPAIILPDETPATLFALVAAGYVIVLAVGAYNTHVERASVPGFAGGLGRGIALTAAGAALLAWLGAGLVATTIPERGTAWLGGGDGQGAILLGDPSQDLIRNIRANSTQTVITYQTEDGRGRYLRLAALSSFDATGFHLVPTDLLAGEPPVTDAGVLRSPTSRISLRVADFGSEWLPLPWVPRTWSAAGDWRYDPRTLAVVALGDDRQLATRNLSYTATAYDFAPDQDEVGAASAGNPNDGGLTLELPDGLDPQVRGLAAQVTQGATTDGERIQRLVQWFHSDQFTYSTATVAGSTLDTVSDFLLASRTGYCEQFSGSLAILARALDIPSRVVIGFLPGEKKGDDFVVTVRQMHAWTEVYLAGLGWVSFDPTPTGAANAAPVPTPTAATNIPEPSVPTTTRQPVDPGASTPNPSAPATNLAWLVTLGWVGLGLVVLALLALTPRAVRAVRRWRRLGQGREPAIMVEDAWDEVRDEVLDAGHDWPSGSPRQVADELARLVHTDEVPAVRALALQVERTRFAPRAEDLASGLPDPQPEAPGASQPDAPALARRIARGLHSNRGVTPSKLRRYFPRSVLRLPDWLRLNG